MPELPEVETIRVGLCPRLLDRKIVRVQVFHDRSIRHFLPGKSAFVAALEGQHIVSVARRGKFLWCRLANGQALVAHLGMSGQLLIDEAATNVPHMGQQVGTDNRHLRARIEMDTADVLRFVDQRTFGHLLVDRCVPTSSGAPGGRGELLAIVPQFLAKRIARDPLDPAFNGIAVVRALKASSRPIKTLLLDQGIASGIGSIYADEALFSAGIHPACPGNCISNKNLHALLQASVAVMSKAIAAGGTSFDALYVNAQGTPGYFARELQVYGRAGQACRHCGQILSVTRVQGRSAVFCLRCQKECKSR